MRHVQMIPPVYAVEIKPTLLGIAALITAISGIITTVIALRRSRTEEYEHAMDELKEARAESERLAKELHDLKMMQSRARGDKE